MTADVKDPRRRETQIMQEMTSDSAQAAMTKGFQNLVRKKLRAMVSDVAQPLIDEIVEASLRDFEAEIQSYVAFGEMLPTLRIVVDYKSKHIEGEK